MQYPPEAGEIRKRIWLHQVCLALGHQISNEPHPPEGFYVCHRCGDTVWVEGK